MHSVESTGRGGQGGRGRPAALALLTSHRPRNVGWLQAGGLLFGDWGTSRLYVLGLAFLFAGRTSFWLILLMSALILAVGWAYTQICRIYPDGGGVYTAAKSRNKTLAVIGALLLFADYTVTASLSVLDAFHYFGLPLQHHAQVEHVASSSRDAGDAIVLDHPPESGEAEGLFAWDSPGLWAIVAIAAIGAFNLMGPKHTGGFAIFAAVGMIAITLLITGFALPQVPWHDLPHRVPSLAATLENHPAHLWVAFVSIVLALSGVEAIANLTGVMRKPVYATASKAIWVVAIEVAAFNVLLAVVMLAIFPLDRTVHVNDMLAFLTKNYVGPWGEWAVRILGGLLLLSAGNTALTDMISVQYLMARDGELPQAMQHLNRFGVPWIPAVVAAAVPIVVLVISHNLEHLAALYAIGVIGAVAINVTLCALHPRLRRLRRKAPMMLLGVLLLTIWVTLAFTKLHALLFVGVVMVVGLTARQLTKAYAARRPKPSLLRRAIVEQLPDDAFAKPRVMIGTYGSVDLAHAAIDEAKRLDAVLVVCFVRQVALSYKYESEQQLGIDTDLAAQRTFARFLELGHDAGVPVIPAYDTGPDAAEVMAENAAVNGVSRVLIGTSRKGAVYHLIKGHFQRRLEALLPPDVPVEVISPAGEHASPELAEATA
jgi:amino acid transporter